jgi:hypothetical protein
LQLANKQAEQDQINAELRAQVQIPSHPPPIDTRDKEDKRAVEESPLVTLFHNYDEPKTISFNGSQRVTVYPGENTVPLVFAKIYANWLQDEDYRVKNDKLLQDKVRLHKQIQALSGAR